MIQNSDSEKDAEQMPDQVLSVKVQTPHKNYPIYLSKNLPVAEYLRDYMMAEKKPVLHIITDKNIHDIYGTEFSKRLSDGGIKHHFYPLQQQGEGGKSLNSYQYLLDQLLQAHIQRNHVVVAWGGGVVGDVAGFVAASILRGVPFIQIPTTLLAQVDSSVGGKTGINMQAGKNLVGAFYQPEMVLIDIAVLDSLPMRELKAGYAEIVKYGLINDAPFFSWLQQSGKQILELDEEALLYAIMTSCRAKAAIVSQDEHEAGIRASLNLGHSFGHALEKLAGYDTEILLHGEAVAIGTCLAFHYAELAGLSEAQGQAQADIVRQHFEDMGMPTDPHALALKSPLTADNLLDAMRHDKKNYNQYFTLIVPQKIGKIMIKSDILEQDLLQIIQKLL